MIVKMIARRGTNFAQSRRGRAYFYESPLWVKLLELCRVGRLNLLSERSACRGCPCGCFRCPRQLPYLATSERISPRHPSTPRAHCPRTQADPSHALTLSRTHTCPYRVSTPSTAVFHHVMQCANPAVADGA